MSYSLAELSLIECFKSLPLISRRKLIIEFSKVANITILSREDDLYIIRVFFHYFEKFYKHKLYDYNFTMVCTDTIYSIYETMNFLYQHSRYIDFDWHKCKFRNYKEESDKTDFTSLLKRHALFLNIISEMRENEYKFNFIILDQNKEETKIIELSKKSQEERAAFLNNWSSTQYTTEHLADIDENDERWKENGYDTSNWDKCDYSF